MEGNRQAPEPRTGPTSPSPCLILWQIHHLRSHPERQVGALSQFIGEKWGQGGSNFLFKCLPVDVDPNSSPHLQLWTHGGAGRRLKEGWRKRSWGSRETWGTESRWRRPCLLPTGIGKHGCGGITPDVTWKSLGVIQTESGGCDSPVPHKTLPGPSARPPFFLLMWLLTSVPSPGHPEATR